MSNQNPRRLAAIEPFWEWGSVGYMFIRSDGAVRALWLPVKEVIRTDAGWDVIAGKDELLFEVDEWGESAICVPWDADIDKQYVEYHRRRRPLEAGPVTAFDALLSLDFSGNSTEAGVKQ